MLPLNPSHEIEVLKYLREITLLPELNGYSLTGLTFRLGSYFLIKFAKHWLLP